mmetsp:Transcript_41367/g.77330  ORF Transcript_41367/g.77330 Transcript_41367/m.77330 type:complete len:251 (-) Transcript_41367:1172-1924(-)
MSSDPADAKLGKEVVFFCVGSLPRDDAKPARQMSESQLLSKSRRRQHAAKSGRRTGSENKGAMNRNCFDGSPIDSFTVTSPSQERAQASTTLLTTFESTPALPSLPSILSVDRAAAAEQFKQSSGMAKSAEVDIPALGRCVLVLRALQLLPLLLLLLLLLLAMLFRSRARCQPCRLSSRTFRTGMSLRHAVATPASAPRRSTCQKSRLLLGADSLLCHKSILRLFRSRQISFGAPHMRLGGLLHHSKVDC